jgi:predicted SAM-dependent methyltransferase
MGKETSKSYNYRLKKGYDKYLQGKGVDIGHGGDLLSMRMFTGISELTPYDLIDDSSNDAVTCHNLPDEAFDFVYSSHCLEHTRDPHTTFSNWIRICKTGGHIFTSVPHEVFYEKCQWPSRFAPSQIEGGHGHHCSWTLEWKSNLPQSINVKDFIKKFEDEGLVEFVLAETALEHFDFRNFFEDQTRSKAICQIDFVVRKR